MIGHFILNAKYKGKLHRVSNKHFDGTGKITHVTIFPLEGTPEQVLKGHVKVAVDQIELHQAA